MIRWGKNFQEGKLCKTPGQLFSTSCYGDKKILIPDLLQKVPDGQGIGSELPRGQ